MATNETQWFYPAVPHGWIRAYSTTNRQWYYRCVQTGQVQYPYPGVKEVKNPIGKGCIWNDFIWLGGILGISGWSFGTGMSTWGPRRWRKIWAAKVFSVEFALLPGSVECLVFLPRAVFRALPGGFPGEAGGWRGSRYASYAVADLRLGADGLW